jgi:hypothetical protein
MSILINACPKHGTHALQKGVELLGQVAGDVHHIPFGESLPDGTTKHLYIHRDPRNAILSWMRWDGKEITDGTFMAAVRGAKYLPQTRQYLGWLNDRDTYKVRYEDLIADDATLRGIAGFLGVPYLDSAHRSLPGLTRTWRSDHSDFTRIWSPVVARCWTDAGGDELVEQFGYQPFVFRS